MQGLCISQACRAACGAVRCLCSGYVRNRRLILVEGLAEIGVEVEPCLARGWRVDTPAGPGKVGTVVYEERRQCWRCSVLLDQAEEGAGSRWRAFDLVEVVVLGGGDWGMVDTFSFFPL
jgi:hypothetical protein